MLTRADPLPRLLEKVREAFGLATVAMLERAAGGWTTSACAGPPTCPRPELADVDVAVEPDVHLAGRGRSLAASDRRLLEALAGQALLALRNQQVVAEAAEARGRAEATELRSALLSAVGHDLRTPLTSIKAAAGSLRDPQLRLSDHDRSELAATVEESADRLTALVANLLDSSRLATGGVTPDLRPVGFDEIVAQALVTVDGAGRVATDVDERLPEVLADLGLLERVIANVVDNALRHGAGAPVAVRASAHGDRVELRVVDRRAAAAAGEERTPESTRATWRSTWWPGWSNGRARRGAPHPTEWSILELLVRGRLVSRRQLMTEVWGPGDRKETSYLRVHLAQLRRKLEAEPGRPRHLITEAGMGYRFRI